MRDQTLSRDILIAIGRQLRYRYDEFVAGPLPPRLAELMEELRRAEQAAA